MSEVPQVYYSIYLSPVGELLLTSRDGMLTGLNMALQHGKPAPHPKPEWRRDDHALRFAHRQLDAYFEGERQTFDLPLCMTGTPFQKQVWQGLVSIPYGTTISYAELARRIARPGASRRWLGQRPQPHRNHRTVPSCDRRRRHLDRLRRRTRPQGMADLARGRRARRPRPAPCVGRSVATRYRLAYTDRVPVSDQLTFATHTRPSANAPYSQCYHDQSSCCSQGRGRSRDSLLTTAPLWPSRSPSGPRKRKRACRPARSQARATRRSRTCWRRFATSFICPG